MKKNSIQKSLTVLFVFVSLLFQDCTNQDAIKPQTNSTASATETDVLEKIKTLGFADETIKDMGNYYLAEGDIYFPKVRMAPKEKPKQKVIGDYPIFYIHMDESISNDPTWNDGMETAIEKWNANKDMHFHFELTNSDEADIVVLKDDNLPQDLPMAAAFPWNGRIGSTIRINSNFNQLTANGTLAEELLHSLKHCASYQHKNLSTKNVIQQPVPGSNTRTNDDASLRNNKIFAIQNDGLWSRDIVTGKSKQISVGWLGSEAMTYSGLYIFIVQFGYLYQVGTDTPWKLPVGGGWEGTSCMTSIDGSGVLYIVCNGTMWVESGAGPTAGAPRQLRASNRDSDAVAMVGYTNDPANKPYIAVLYNKQPLSMKLINTNGTDKQTVQFPTNALPGVNTFKGITFLRALLELVVYHNGYIYTLSTFSTTGAVEQPVLERWLSPGLNLTSLTSFLAYSINIIDGGTMYELFCVLSVSGNPGDSKLQMDRVGDWADVTLTTTNRKRL